MNVTNKTIKKILSIALCLALVMSYVPMVSITASAVESTIPVIEGYGFDSDDSEFGAVFINPITSYTSATGTTWSDEAGKGNLIFQWGYGDILDVTLVDPDSVVTYETSNIQAHSDDSKSSDLHWTEFPLSSAYEDGTYITATRGFDNYTNDEFRAYGTGSVANVFTQTVSGEPGFLSDDMLMYGEAEISNGTASVKFKHIPATFRFIITNTHEKALSLESVTLRVVDADGTSVPAAAKYCDIEIEAENRYPELFYRNFAYSTYDSVTTNLSDYTLEAGESYLAYALALPLGNMDTEKHDDTAFEGKTIQVGVTTSEGECIALELEADEIANANPGNAYNWVGGKSYTMRMGTRCADGCTLDAGKCTVCGYECTHNFNDKGFCTDCGGYQNPDVNPGEDPEWEYDDIYLVENAGQLFWIANYVNNVSNEINVLLTTDITIPEGKEWTPIMNFYGTFDGGYYTVSGLDASGDEFVGMFGGGSYAYGTIKNLHITNSRFEGTSYVGALAGYHAGNIYNCYVDSSVTVTGDSSTGLLVGHNAGAVKNCYAYGSSCVGYYDGNYSTVENCYYLSENETEDGGKTAEQFASGEVAYLLQQGNTEQVWGQDNNQAGATPVFDATGLYKVVTVGETGNYSVANVGDTNSDGTVDVTDYQSLVNKALTDDHEQIETASYDDIIRYDLDGDGYIDVIDASFMHLFVNGFVTVDVYAVGDYDLNGVAFEEADIKAIKHAIKNPEKLATYKKYASDINGDGKLDENDLTALTAKYGEVTGTECADNVEVYYRWGNKYSTCTATAMCTLCGEKVAVETVNTTSETLAELTCTQDGKVKYTATFQNELLGTKTIEIVSKTEGHKYNDNGFCLTCDVYQPAELNESGYYEIGNAGQLFWFAQQVNVEGNKEIKGALTADIDLENKPWTPIGAMGEENSFRGVFDGQNYTIRGLNVEGSENGVGFFGEVRTGTVKNFTIYGEVIVNAEVDYVGGVIGSICGLDSENDLERNGAVIQNITSYVNVTAKAHGIGMIGGFVGYADHQSLIEKCSWYGTFDAGEYRVDSGAAGFIGKIQENTSEVTIRNCGAYGTIKTNYAGDYNNTTTIYMGGFLSFSNMGAKTTLENCLFAGKFERGENLTDEARLGAFGMLRSVKAIKNCYYLGDDGLAAVHSDSDLNPESDNVEITRVTEDDLRNNTIATQLGEYWEQGEHYPVIKK